MNNIVKIILSLILALVIFLAGWFAHAWKNRGKVAKEAKEALLEVNKLHKQAIMAIKDDYEKKLKKKDEIINKLLGIIDRLLQVLQPLQGTGAYGVDSLISKLNLNKEKLHSIN